MLKKQFLDLYVRLITKLSNLIKTNKSSEYCSVISCE